MKKKVVILGGPTVKHVNGWQLSKSLRNEKESVKSFSGGTTKQMLTFVKPTIEENPDFMMMKINCFCGMVDGRKTISLISSQDHCQRFSPSQISDTSRAVFEPA